jgi:hypothetical protein
MWGVVLHCLRSFFRKQNECNGTKLDFGFAERNQLALVFLKLIILILLTNPR